jgi:pectate lyase
MPRVRFGKIHLFNNLWTSYGNKYCVGLGVSANILAEGNAFEGVSIPFNVTDYISAESVLVATGNLFVSTTGNTSGRGTSVFVPPPYDYVVDDVCGVADAVMRGAGPQ